MAKKHILTLVKKTVEERTIEIVTDDDWSTSALNQLMWEQINATTGGDGTQKKWLDAKAIAWTGKMTVIEDSSTTGETEFQVRDYAIQTDNSNVPDADKHVELWEKLQLVYFPQEDGLWGEAKEQQI